MQSSKMSQNSKKTHTKTQFSFQMYATLLELYYAETPIKIEHMVPEI